MQVGAHGDHMIRSMCRPRAFFGHHTAMHLRYNSCHIHMSLTWTNDFANISRLSPTSIIDYTFCIYSCFTLIEW